MGTVTFLHVALPGKEPPDPSHMLASVRQSMPGWKIVQMSDEQTADAGADEVIRRPFDGFLMTFRLKHLAEFPGEHLVLDSDVLVKRSVEHVFETPFDVALTYRDKPVPDPNGIDVAKLFPYNTGVVFSRNRHFWLDCLAVLDQQGDGYKQWYGDQLAVVIVAESGRYRVLRLPCDQYNWTPVRQHSVSDAFCWHFKGLRKSWISSAATI